jgi:hypothetical protein
MCQLMRAVIRRWYSLRIVPVEAVRDDGPWQRSHGDLGAAYGLWGKLAIWGDSDTTAFRETASMRPLSRNWTPKLYSSQEALLGIHSGAEVDDDYRCAEATGDVVQKLRTVNDITSYPCKLTTRFQIFRIYRFNITILSIPKFAIFTSSCSSRSAERSSPSSSAPTVAAS